MGEKSEPDSEEESQPVDKDSTDEDDINPFEEDPQADVVFKASEEFAETGEISEATQAAIEEMSGKEVMDAYTRINKMVAEGGY